MGDPSGTRTNRRAESGKLLRAGCADRRAVTRPRLGTVVIHNMMASRPKSGAALAAGDPDGTDGIDVPHLLAVLPDLAMLRGAAIQITLS